MMDITNWSLNMGILLTDGSQPDTLRWVSVTQEDAQMKPRVRARSGQPVAHWNQKRREWETRIELPTDPGQPRDRKWIRAKTEEECVAKAWQAQGQLADHVTLPDDSETLGAVARQWLAFMEGRVVDGSWAAYRTRVNLHILPLLGTRRLTALKTRDVDEWQKQLETKGLGVATRREIRSTLVIIIEWAQARDMVSRNVAALSAGPRGSGQKVETLTKAQAKAVLEQVSGWRMEAAVILMMMTGLRIGETLGLRWSDISEGRVTIAGQLVTKPGLHYQPYPKTGRSYRTVDLPPRAQAALDALGPAEPSAYVFLNSHQGLMAPSVLARELRTRTISLGVNVHPHKLRHTAASLMIDRGVRLEIVSKVLGHKSIRTTSDIYGHLLPDGRAEAAAAIEEALG
jgi:integrase